MCRINTDLHFWGRLKSGTVFLDGEFPLGIVHLSEELHLEQWELESSRARLVMESRRIHVITVITVWSQFTCDSEQCSVFFFQILL